MSLGRSLNGQTHTYTLLRELSAQLDKCCFSTSEGIYYFPELDLINGRNKYTLKINNVTPKADYFRSSFIR